MNGTATPYDTGPKSLEGESGALDNVLTLNPNDPRFEPTVKNWKDDGVYQITGGRIRQVSPGQFEVIDLKFGENEEMPAEDEAAQRADEKTPPKGSYNNPAVENLQL